MRKEKRFNSFRILVAKVLVCSFIASFVLMPNVYAAEASVAPQISKKNVEMVAGGTYDLNIKNKVENSTYAWTVSRDSIATVSKAGVVKALKKGKVVVACNVKTPKGSYRLTSIVTIREGAKEFKISNKVQTLNVGQKYNLNRTLKPASSNDLTTWKSSDATIAKPDSKGKFTALKEGSVTITGSTLSGKKDSVTINVIDEAGTVTTQDELAKLLGSGAQRITIKTDSSITFNIPAGDYGKQKLVVDAPNADVVNKGVFKSVDIANIKATTWYENAVGNRINVTAPNASIRIEGNASAAIVVSNNATRLNLVNNGTEGSSLTLNAGANVTISGSSTALLPVIANAANATVTSSVPLSLTSNERINLQLNAGAEGTVIQAASNAAIPVLSGTVTAAVTVGTGENAQTVNVTPGTNAGGAGGSSPSTPTTPTDPTDPTPSTLGKITGRVTAVSGGAVSGSAVSGSAVSGSAVSGGAMAVSGASVYLLKYDGDIAAAWSTILTSPNTVLTQTNSEGNYTANNLAPGNYVVAMAKDGYQVLNQLATVTANTTTVVNGVLIEHGGDTANGTASGRIINALNGNPVVSDLTFTVKVFKNFNNTAAADLVATLTATGSNYSLNLPEGYYTIQVIDNREAVIGTTYATTTMNVIVLGGTEFNNQDIVLATAKLDGQATFVLTWGEYPRDLDSHLFGPVSGNADYHIYYGNKVYPEDIRNLEENIPLMHLRLDNDDVTSYGPETTSIYVPVQNGIYTFVVYNYTGNYGGTLVASGAKVVVTSSEGTMTFDVPSGSDQLAWIVCSFDSATGKITPINQLLDAEEYLGHTLEGCRE